MTAGPRHFGGEKDEAMQLENRVAWVTGAAKRLGRAMALDLARAGANIVVHYNRSEAEAHEVVGEIEAMGRRAMALQADLSDVDQIQRAGRKVEEQFGGLDLMINSASNFERVELDKLTEADWDDSFKVNLKAPFFCALEAARLMRMPSGAHRGGKIINFADSAALRPYINHAPYMIAKGGIITMTRVLALELAPDIQVNCIAPGVVMPPEDTSPEEMERIVRNVPLDRIGSPEDIVATMRYLVSGTDYVTGQVICVDGGRLWAQPKRR